MIFVLTSLWLLLASVGCHGRTTHLSPEYASDDSYLYQNNDNGQIAIGVPVCTTMNSCEDEYSDKDAKACGIHTDCIELVNLIDKVPANVSQLSIRSSYFTNLTYVDLKNFTSLTVLKIKYNDIAYIAPGSFQSQKSLKELTIEGNNVADILIGTFDGLRSVTLLTFNFNGLVRISAGSFRGLSVLKKLDLAVNSLHSLEDDVFSGAPLLQRILLQDNNISYIAPNAFRGLSMLEELNLNINKIVQIPSDALKIIPQLSTLELGKNPISEITRQSFKGMKALRVLWLDGCGIARVAKRAFNNKKLTLLSLEQNQLTRLPSLGKMTQLDSFYLEGNPWSCDCDSVAMLRWLRRNGFGNLTIECDAPTARRSLNLLSFSGDELCQPIEPHPVTRPPFADDIQPTDESLVPVIGDQSPAVTNGFEVQATDLSETFVSTAQADSGSGHDDSLLTESMQDGDDDNRISTISFDDMAVDSRQFSTHDNLDLTSSGTNPTEKGTANFVDRVDFSVIVTIAVAMTVGVVAMVALIVLKVGSGRRQRRHAFRRSVDLALSMSHSEKGFRLHHRKNEKRKKPDVSKEQNGKPVVTKMASLNSDENSNKAGPKDYCDVNTEDPVVTDQDKADVDEKHV